MLSYTTILYPVRISGIRWFPVTPKNGFVDTLTSSLNRVNELDKAKATAIDDFASGRNQNVHDL
ncbi:MAG: flagellar hook-basal body complex protein FliE, partial [Lachnospiraceae bacterium]|nr:flagellar hook-basal body complex protein FliE [Lachnospiraceae bacterium]